MPVLTVKKPAKNQFPSLRAAMWLYFLVLIGTAGVTILLAYQVDPAFVQLIVGLVFPAGLSAIVVYRTRARLDELFGRLPDLLSLVTSISIGLALGVLALWGNFLIYNWLQSNVGQFPNPLESNISLFSLILQSVILLPLFQGLLFWGVIRRAAAGLGTVKGLLLLAALFGMYGLFTSLVNLGMTDMASQFIVGLVAALAIYYTDCAWYGVIIAASYNLFWICYQNNLLNIFQGILTYLGSDGSNLLSVRWLFLVIIAAFLAFIFLQVIRLRARIDIDEYAAPPTKRFWSLPLVLSILFILLASYGEVVLRKQSPPATAVTRQAAPADTSGSTIPPIPATTAPSQ